MKKALFLFTILFNGHLIFAQNEVSEKAALTQAQSDILLAQTKDFPANTQISLAIIERGVTKYYGVIRVADTIIYTDNKDKIFEIGSVSKVFTATLLAKAVLDQKIKLRDNINQFYDFPFKDGIQLDFESLANHTAGLDRLPSNLDFSTADPGNPYKTYGAPNLKAYLKDALKLKQTVEKKYDYSNLGAGLLGYTLGVLQQSTYENLLHETIFTKYKMDHSFTSRTQVESGLVKGLDVAGNEVPNWDFDVLCGAGGILSTVSDLFKFVHAQFDATNQELALTRVPTFTINEKMKIGLGWHIVKSGSDREIYWHNGGTGGYSSSMTMDLERKNGIVVLSNVSAFNPNMRNIDNLCFQLLKTLGQ